MPVNQKYYFNKMSNEKLLMHKQHMEQRLEAIENVFKQRKNS